MSENRYVIPRIVYNTYTPSTTDDESKGYVIGQPWFDINARNYFICVDNTKDDAKWFRVNLRDTLAEYKTGISYFYGHNYPRQILHGMQTNPSFISVFPIEEVDPEYPVGDIWASISDDGDVYVYNTGTSQVKFCWFTCSGESSYNTLEVKLFDASNGALYTHPYVGLIDSNMKVFFPANEYVYLLPVPYENSQFKGWASTEDGRPSSNTAFIIMTSDRYLEVHYTAPQMKLEVEVLGHDYAIVTSDKISCGSICSATYNQGEKVTLSYTFRKPDVVFYGWEGCDEVDEDGNCIVYMYDNRKVAALFEANLPTLYIHRVGYGDVEDVTHNKIFCGDTCFAQYNWDKMIELNAYPARGSRFVGWFGDYEKLQDQEINYELTSDSVIDAVFDAEAFLLRVSKEGNGFVSSGSIDCGDTCYAKFNAGEPIHLNAEPDDGYYFKEWVYAGETFDSKELNDVRIHSDTEIIAVFNKKSYNVDVNIGENGDVADFNNQPEYKDDVIIEPLPNEGYIVDEWEGCDEVLNGKCFINGIISDREVSVTFKEEITGSDASKEYGYVCGGYENNKHITQFIFPFDSGTVEQIGELSHTNYNSAANHSSTHGYVCGGGYDGVVYNHIDSFTFESGTTFRRHRECIFKQGWMRASATNDTQYGYVCGGNWKLTTVSRYTFPFDLGEIEQYTKLTNKYSGDSFNSSQYGYVTGVIKQGINTTDILNHQETMEKFSFTNSSDVIETVKLARNLTSPVAINDTEYGYIISGYRQNIPLYYDINNYTNRVSLAIDSGEAVLFSNLENDKVFDQMSANNSSQYGYVCGGNDLEYNAYSYVNRLEFSAISNKAENVSYLDDSRHATSATDGTMFW